MGGRRRDFDSDDEESIRHGRNVLHQHQHSRHPNLGPVPPGAPIPDCPRCSRRAPWGLMMYQGTGPMCQRCVNQMHIEMLVSKSPHPRQRRGLFL